MNPLVEKLEIRDVPGADLKPERFTLPPPLTWTELRQPVDFKDNLLGDRFLERGRGLIIYGPAGCGKSVAAHQASAEWSAGIAGLHITPAFPLKIIILQTEDSLNDLRESLAGILASSIFTSEKLALVERNLIILPPVPGGTGADLAQLLNAAASDHKPHLIQVNPLLAFCPGDPARELGGLLYQVVDPIIKRHNVSFLGVHHTPKTNNRDTSGYGAHDYQYLAAGDARVANWPRAMIQIEPVVNGVYRFRASKRWQRIGWTWDNQPTSERYFRHSKNEVRWLDATPDEAAAAAAVENYQRILEVLPNPEQPGISRDRIRATAKTKLNIGKDKADSWLKLAREDGLVECQETRTDNNRKTTLFRRANGQ